MDKLRDVRDDEDIEFGNIIEISGDFSMGFFQTDKGYRLILSSYNMNKISQYFISKKNEEE